MSRHTIEELRGRTGKLWIAVRNMVRRVAISRSNAGGLWQALGYDPGTDGKRETFNGVEVFPGIGFFARPKAGGKPEAIILNVGAAHHPVIIATRDKSLQVSLDEDETAVFNSSAVITIKKTGEIWITDRATGAAAPLATKADLDTLRAAVLGAVIAPGDGGAALKAAILAAAWPVGTTVLKGK